MPYTLNMLFNVTSAALEALLHGRISEGHPSGQVMRVIWDGDELVFELDEPDLLDMVFRCDGEPVLLVDPDMNADLGDMTLDVTTNDGDYSFVLTASD